LVFIVTVQGLVVFGVQFADHPPKPPGVAVSVTLDPRGKKAVHPDPEPLQLIPAGLLTTDPVPAPTKYTLSEGRPDPPLPGFTPKLEAAITSVPFCAVALAVMFVRQGAGGVQPTAVARPDESIVATSMSLEAQVTVLVRSTVIGLAVNVPIAMNCAVSPSAFKVCDPMPGMMLMVDNVRG
jgi:hypothetical protein